MIDLCGVFSSHLLNADRLRVSYFMVKPINKDGFATAVMTKDGCTLCYLGKIL